MTRIPTQSEIDALRATGWTGSDFEAQDTLIAKGEAMTMDSELQRLAASTIRRAVGPTILLGSGTYFDFDDPDSNQITIDDVAFGLAYEGRFAGQCYSHVLKRRVFYPVAQHCVLLTDQVPLEHRYAVLWHEAGEPVCGDMVGPLKSMAPDYKAVEKRCEASIQKRFGVDFIDHDLIKRCDIRMWATERRDLLKWSGEEWSNTDVQPYDIEIVPWSPDEAAVRFINRFYELAPLHILNQPFARSEYV